MRLTEAYDRYNISTKEEAIEKLQELSYSMNEYLKIMQEKHEFGKVNLIGIGNSISAGWSKVDQDVMPFVNKFGKIYKDTVNDNMIETHSFTIMDKNSNQAIYEFLLQNPTLTEVYEVFEKDFRAFKKIFRFRLSPFRNKIDWEIAKTLYEKSELTFEDCYKKDDINISLFNGFTGGLLFEPQKILTKEGREETFNIEIIYAKKIIDLLKELNSYIIIGNFPEFSTKLGDKLNKLIDEFNEKIKEFTIEEKITYLNYVTLQGFQKYNGKACIDNHPTIDEQYTSLYRYINYLYKIYLPNIFEEKSKTRTRR